MSRAPVRVCARHDSLSKGLLPRYRVLFLIILFCHFDDDERCHEMYSDKWKSTPDIMETASIAQTYKVRRGYGIY